MLQLHNFHELWANHGSPIGEQALKFFIQLYEIEREVRDLPAEERKTIRQDKTKRIADVLHQWLTQ
jgi:transposase